MFSRLKLQIGLLVVAFIRGCHLVKELLGFQFLQHMLADKRDGVALQYHRKHLDRQESEVQ